MTNLLQKLLGLVKEKQYAFPDVEAQKDLPEGVSNMQEMRHFVARLPEQSFRLTIDRNVLLTELSLNPPQKEPEGFDCGAVGCIVGWMPVRFGDKYQWFHAGSTTCYRYYVDIAMEVFGCSWKVALYLCSPGEYYDSYPLQIPRREEVLARMDRVLNYYGENSCYPDVSVVCAWQKEKNATHENRKSPQSNS